MPEEKGPLIQSPSARTPYLIRPDAPPEFQRLALVAAPGTGAAVHYWYVDGRYVGHASPETPCFVTLEPGRHSASVTDDLGRGSQIHFMVRELADPQRGTALRDAARPR